MKYSLALSLLMFLLNLFECKIRFQSILDLIKFIFNFFFCKIKGMIEKIFMLRESVRKKVYFMHL